MIVSDNEIIDELNSTMKENPKSTIELFNHLRECVECRIRWLSMVKDVRKHIEVVYNDS